MPSRDDQAAPREASRTAQISALTGLRGFAALVVVLIHTAGRTEYYWLGIPEYGPVSLFVLSGFLLYRPWARWSLKAGPRPGVATFAKRRITRIFPPYLLVFLCVVAVMPAARPSGSRGWLASLSLTNIYVQGSFTSPFLHTWSLGTELSWYVALPVFGVVTAAVARRLGVRVGVWVAAGMIALALPATIAWRAWIHASEYEGYTRPFWLPGYLVCFGAGALVAHLVEARRAGVIQLTHLRRAAADHWVLPVIALVVLLLGTSTLSGPDFWLDWTYRDHQVRFAVAVMLAVTLLMIAVFGNPGSPVHRALTTRASVAVGRWSYGIYLWHLPIIWILVRYLAIPEGPGGLVIWLLLVLGISIPLAAATFAWIERPLLAWARGERRTPAAPQPEPDAAIAPDRRDEGSSATSSTTAQASQPSSTPSVSVLPGA